MNCRVERVVGDILLANGTNMFAWSLSKGRKLYTFHFNNSRAISKDSVYLVDQTDDSLTIMQRNAGGNYKFYMRLPAVTSFCVDNALHLLSCQTQTLFLVYDLREKEIIYSHERMYRFGYQCWTKFSSSRKFLLRHVYMEAQLYIERMDGEKNANDDRWLSCDFVEFIGDSDVIYYVTRFGELRRRDCNNATDECLIARDAQKFVQSPLSKFTAVKIGYYTNRNQPQYVEFFKDGLPWTRFNQIPDISHFLSENMLAVIVQRPDEETSQEYDSLYTGLIFQTTDEWQTCEQIAYLRNCQEIFIDQAGDVYGIYNRNTFSVEAISIEKINL